MNSEFHIHSIIMPRANIPFEQVLLSSTTDRRVEVLRSIHQSGSISEAARLNGVSYKAAWQALETLSNLAGVALVAKAVGGSGGGGAKLTPEGLQVLEAADMLQAARLQALAQMQTQSQKAQKTKINFKGISALGLRTSMRNQLPCEVAAMDLTGHIVRITLQLADGQRLISSITHESLQLLGLKVGAQVLAMFKATAVTMAPEIVAIGGVNLLQGKVMRRMASPMGIEVSVQLSPGQSVVGFCKTPHSLKLRQSATVAVEETSVVIAQLS